MATTQLTRVQQYALWPKDINMLIINVLKTEKEQREAKLKTNKVVL